MWERREGDRDRKTWKRENCAEAIFEKYGLRIFQN